MKRWILDNNGRAANFSALFNILSVTSYVYTQTRTGREQLMIVTISWWTYTRQLARQWHTIIASLTHLQFHILDTWTTGQYGTHSLWKSLHIAGFYRPLGVYTRYSISYSVHFHILLSKQEIANFRESQKSSSVETLLPTTMQIHRFYPHNLCAHPPPSIAPDIWYNEKQEKTRETPLCILRVKE